MMEETLYSIHLAIELCMEFFIDILQHLIIQGDTMYNVFGRH